ncbi:MAG: hypothetical protein JWL60_589, partial [Gemmatimonadetes bacterium]|nr:hypothetical protein [Gemmatimonadota bacterium]
METPGADGGTAARGAVAAERRAGDRRSLPRRSMQGVLRQIVDRLADGIVV